MEIGTQVGPYRIESFLGQGGMAQVYRARHGDLHRAEALKVLPPNLAADRTFVTRFLAEARTAASLHHPNIATIYAVSEANAAQPYFTMELVEGGDLADYLAENGALSLEGTRPFLEQIAAALDYAHGRGLMHRDVKPANVLLETQGDQIKLKLVDFGLARAHQTSGDTRLTQSGMIVGTPEYMSPEQAGSGAPVDHRTDVYALGVVAYEMLCGRPPFRAEKETSMLAVIMQHVRDQPRPPLEIAPQIGRAANAAILRALAKNPADRFNSCSEFIVALYGAKPVRVAAPKSPRKPASLMPLWVGLVLLGGVGLVSWSVLGARGSSVEEVMTPQNTASASINEAPLLEPTAPPIAPQVATISVPQIVGMNEGQAREILKANGLAAEVTTGYSEAFDAQKVMSQFPSPGATVNAGAPVRFRISVGSKNPRIVRVPVEVPVEVPIERSTPAPVRDVPVASSGTWLVIFGSFPHSRSGEAQSKARRVGATGWDARVIDTDDYPGLADGLYAIVAGPYSKSDARRQLASAKSNFSDAYIKSGW